MNAESLYAQRDQPEKKSKWEKKKDMGWPSFFGERGLLNFIFKKDFYTFPTNDVAYIIFWP